MQKNTFKVAMIELKPMVYRRNKKKKSKGSIKRTSSILWNMMDNYTKHDDLAYVMYNDMAPQLNIYKFEDFIKKIERMKPTETQFMPGTITFQDVDNTDILVKDNIVSEKTNIFKPTDGDQEAKFKSFIDIDFLKLIEEGVDKKDDDFVVQEEENDDYDETLKYQALTNEIHNESDLLKQSETKYKGLFNINDEMSWMEYIFSDQWFKDAVNSIDLKLLTSIKVFYEIFSGKYDLYTIYSAYKLYTSSVDWETFFAREIGKAKIAAAEVGIFILLVIIKNLSSLIRKTPQTDIITMASPYIIPLSYISHEVIPYISSTVIPFIYYDIPVI